MKYKLFTDGSHKKLVNKAACGGYLENQDGEIVFSFSEEIKDPNLFNYHELLALYKGLTLCIEKGIKKVDCFNDLKQISQVLNIESKHVFLKFYTLDSLYYKIWLLKSKFEKINFFHIARSKNKIADKLSRKKISNYKITENSHNITNIFSKNQFLHKSGRNKFYSLIKDISVYYIFELIEKNKGTKLERFINIYKAKIKDNITVTLLKTEKIPQSFSLNSIILNYINLTLKESSEKDIGIYFKPEHLSVSHILKRFSSLNKKVYKALDELKEISNKMNKIVIHQHPEITNYFYNIPNIKNIKRKTNNFNKFKNIPQNTIIEYIKILGDNYIVGSRRDIEEPLEQINFKIINSIEIQKKYFSILLQLKLQDEIKKKKEKNELFVWHNKKDIPNKISELKKELIKKGVKISF